jgi:uncharacterized protein (DUF1810 family)
MTDEPPVAGPDEAPDAGPDPFHLDRFVQAQARTYAGALGELRRGSKTGHWIWFVFPQLTGLGHSPMAEHYGIASLAEARAYLAHPVLGPRLVACCRALLGLSGVSAEEAAEDLPLDSTGAVTLPVGGRQIVTVRFTE